MSGFVSVGEGGSAIVAVVRPEPVTQGAVAVRQKVRWLDGSMEGATGRLALGVCPQCAQPQAHRALRACAYPFSSPGAKAIEEQRQS